MLTVLTSAGPLLTKVFSASGMADYDDAKNFKVNTAKVDSLDELAVVLDKLRSNPRRCVIRGEFIGEEAAAALFESDKPGLYQRLNMLFRETPRHWVMFDIDKYSPVLYDPVAEPLEAIQEFIESELPAEFHGANFVWQMSSSAGQKPGLLKAHVWFWSDIAYTGTQWRDYVRGNKLPIDVAPFRRVQIHYTADPVFQDGAVDPMALRFGYQSGGRPTVSVEMADAPVEDEGNGDYTMTDPCTKPGAIGAVCRAWPIRRVIEELLPDHFQMAIGSDKRVTWLGGGGAPEGAFITDDGLFLGNTHNTDPFENRLTNAFDLIRWFLFGEKDTDLDLVTTVTSRPSYRAMLDWAESEESVRGELRAEAGSVIAMRDAFVARIRDAADELALREEVIRDIKLADLSSIDREALARAVQARMQSLLGSRVAIGDARDLVTPDRVVRGAGGEINRPSWLEPWVYVTSGDVFYNLITKEITTRQGFDFSFSRNMLAFADDEGNVPRPSEFAATVWQLQVVARTAYNPQCARVFHCDGLDYGNTYSTIGIPDMPPVFTDAEAKFINKLETHAAMMLPIDRERMFFLDWLAHNVQHPGVKIRWSPYLHGAPGAGKSLWHRVLMAAMGTQNVSVLSSDVLVNSPFNSWANETAVVTIEEVKTSDHNARDVENKLKEPISNPTVQIHVKGRSPFNVPNVTNYMLFSNFADGLNITDEDRRYLVLRAALEAEQLKKLSESGHFDELFDGLEMYRGAVRKWLFDRALSADFDPNGRAPVTEAKAHSVELSKSDVRGALDELLETGALGVTKNIVSSPHLCEAIHNLTGLTVYTKSTNSMLSQAGFQLYDRIKWKGRPCRIWYRGTLPEGVTHDDIRKHLDATEHAEFLMETA